MITLLMEFIIILNITIMEVEFVVKSNFSKYLVKTNLFDYLKIKLKTFWNGLI